MGVLNFCWLLGWLVGVWYSQEDVDSLLPTAPSLSDPDEEVLEVLATFGGVGWSSSSSRAASRTESVRPSPSSVSMLSL